MSFFLTLYKVFPPKVWLVLGLLFAGAMIIMTAFDKGSEYGEGKCIEAGRKAADAALEEALTNAQADLEKAVEKQRDGLDRVRVLNSQVASSEQKTLELQKALDDAINNPPTSCNKLDPRYYRLLQEKLNQDPPKTSKRD
jgi:hypothetical protein